MDKKWIDCVNKLYCALDLNRRAVSVTFLKTKAEYDERREVSSKNRLITVRWLRLQQEDIP